MALDRMHLIKMEIRRLNTLRGIAALIVVVSHYSHGGQIFSGFLGAGAGQLGVMLFFVLSGFLMAHLYLGETPTRRNLLNFAVARVARVVPLFVVVVLASYLARRFGGEIESSIAYRIDSVEMLVSHVLFLHGVDLLWTIPPEIQFYLLFGVAWALKPRFGPMLYVVAAITYLVVFFLGFHLKSGTINGIVITPFIVMAIPYFMVGVIFGQLFSSWKSPERITSNWFTASFLIIFLLYPKVFSFITGNEHGMWSDVGVLVAVSGVFFAVVFLIPQGNSLIENRLGDFLGKISYSLYLLHMPVMYLLFVHLGVPRGIPGLVMFIAVATAAAYLSYATIEAPSRRFIRALAAHG